MMVVATSKGVEGYVWSLSRDFSTSIFILVKKKHCKEKVTINLIKNVNAVFGNAIKYLV